MENQIQFTDPQNDSSNSKNKKLTKILLILLPIIVIAYIGFCFFTSLKSSREKARLIIEQQNSNQLDNLKNDQEYARNFQPVASSDFYNNCMKNCSPGGSDGCKNSCIIREAENEKDMSKCDSIGGSADMDGKDSGKAYCQSDVATATMNIDNCEKISYGSKDVKDLARFDCYSGIAKIKKDASICEKIPKNFMLGNVYKRCIELK